MKIQDKGIRTNFNAAIENGKIDSQEMTKIISSAKDGNILTKRERADLERILANHGTKMDAPAKQALVNYLQGLDNCKSGDMEGPPTPRLLQSMAFERAPDGARVVPNNTPRPATAPRRPDPLYIEMDNVELGTKFQLINLSANPSATFDSKDDLKTIEVTGRDIQNRRASVYMDEPTMKKFGIEPGDIFQLRAMDPAGNVSMPVTGEIEPDDWATNNIQDPGATANTFVNAGRGMSLNALDGESGRKAIIVKSVNDARPPQVLEEKLMLVTDDRFDENDKEIATAIRGAWNPIKAALGKEVFNLDEMKTLVDNQTIPEAARNAISELVDDPERFAEFESAHTGAKDGNISINDFDKVRTFARSVTLSAFGAIEPRTTVTVQNQRTGQSLNVVVNDDRELNLNLGDIRDGDPLILTPRDNENVLGKQVELVYSSKCKDGKAPKLTGGLGVRLPGVI